MATKPNKLLVYVTATVSIVLWGMSYIWSNALIATGVPVEYFVFVRVILAGLLLLALNLLLRRSLRICRRDLWKFLLLAACEPLIYFLCETYGIKFTESPTYSALVVATTPIFSIVAGVLLFREKVGWVNIVGMAVCLGGLVMVTLCTESVGERFLLGVCLLLVTALAEVGHASFTKLLASDYRPEVIVMYQFLIGAVYLLPLFLTEGLRDFDAATYLTWDVWGPALGLAVFCSGIAFSLWAVTIKNLGVARACIFLAMIPVVTAVLGFLFGQESLGALQWAGIAVACGGLVLTQRVGKTS